MHMNDLLSAAVNAHGGLSRWNQLKTVTATLSVTGAIWEVKGKPDDGIMVPTKRRVYAPDGNKQKIPNPVLVAIDIRDIAFSADSDAGKTIARRP